MSDVAATGDPRVDPVRWANHALRTPLTAITGYAELLAEQKSGPLTDQQAAWVAEIESSAERLLEAIEQVTAWIREGKSPGSAARASEPEERTAAI